MSLRSRIRSSIRSNPGGLSIPNTLFHFNTDFTNSGTSGAWTLPGADPPTISATNPKFGAGSANGASAGSGGLVPSGGSWGFFIDGATAWTIDCWIYPISSSGNQFDVLELGRVNSTHSFAIYLQPNINSDINLIVPSGGGTLTTSGAITLDAWNHIAITFDGTNYRFFVGGVIRNTIAAPLNFSGQSGTPSIIGWDTFGPGGNHRIDEFRILRGTAAWTSNFTPPTSPYTP